MPDIDEAEINNPTWMNQRTILPTTQVNNTSFTSPGPRPYTPPIGDAKDNVNYGSAAPSGGSIYQNPDGSYSTNNPSNGTTTSTEGGIYNPGYDPYGGSVQQPLVSGGGTGGSSATGGSSGTGGSAYVAPVDTRTQEQKDAAFYAALQSAQTAAANGDPQPLRNFDSFFGIPRPEAQYGADYYNMRLVKGDGPALADNQLQGNGNALYIINREGERFHITATAAQEMMNNGSWKDPEVMNQAQLDNMALRYSIDSAANLGTINGPKYNGFMLVKGDGPALADDQLAGNGNALYAVDNRGNMFHVTGQVYTELIAQNGGVAPTHVVMNQGVIDGMGVDGVMTSASSSSLYNPAAVEVPPPLPPAPEPPTASTPEPLEPNQSEQASVEQRLRDLGITDQQVATFIGMYQSDRTAALNFIDSLNLSPEDRASVIGYVETNIAQNNSAIDNTEQAVVPGVEANINSEETNNTTSNSTENAEVGGSNEVNLAGTHEENTSGEQSNPTETGVHPAVDSQHSERADEAMAAATAKRQSSREERLRKIMEMRKPYTSGGGSSGTDAMIAPAISPASQVPPPPLP